MNKDIEASSTLTILSYFGVEIYLTIDREEDNVVCQVQPKPESVSLNVQQVVSITWVDTLFPHQETGQFFTFKPDPIINDIHPRVTIRRYEMNLKFARLNINLHR